MPATAAARGVRRALLAASGPWPPGPSVMGVPFHGRAGKSGLYPGAYWRAMCMRSSASVSSISLPLTSTVTLWMVPVNLNGLG